MAKIKSMALTLLCAGIVLGVGYLVIVESGKKVLEKERILEEAEYESTSSNIFYGKIEEDIELFPWNYYPEDEIAAGNHYLEGEDSAGIHPDFYRILLDYGESPEETRERADWYLYQMIACESHVRTEDVWKVYQKNQKKIVDSLIMTENSPMGSVYFYRDTLELNQRQYQVRIACSEWNIVSFICQESREEERDREQWEKGKDRLVKTLEESEKELAAYFDYMVLLSNQDFFSMYSKNGDYVNGHMEGLRWLNNILEQKTGTDHMPGELKDLTEAWGFYDSPELYDENKAKDAEYEVEKTGAVPSTDAPEETEGYSYQIVELKDMILLLMQGEYTIGIYYDPVRQDFCGYNYFYEY